jgi:hypothetical protein
MKSPSALSVALAITFACLSAASVAEERPNTTLVQKSKATATPSSTATKAAKAQAVTATGATSTVKTGAGQGMPAAAPAAQQTYEGCHGTGSDA